VAVAAAQEPECHMPHCNVKAEWTGEAYEYEYTDNSATITGTTPLSVCWEAARGYAVTSAWVKTGTQVWGFGPGNNCFQAIKHEASAVVVCTEEATVVRLVEFGAQSADEECFATSDLLVWGLVGLCIGMVLGMVISKELLR
jgi:hypothetical protein